MPIEEPIEAPTLEPEADAPALDAPTPARGERGRFAPREPVAPKEEPVAEVPADLIEQLRARFEGDADPDELEVVAAGLTAEAIAALPAAARAVVRSILNADAKRLTEANEKALAVEAAVAKREEKILAARKDLSTREAAMRKFALSEAVRPPGAPPKVDPLSPEGASALAKHYTQASVAEAMAPAREAAQAADAAARWSVIEDQYPDLRDDAVLAEFEAALVAANKGVDLAKGERPRVTTPDFAAQFFLQREVEQLRAAAKARSDREAVARSDGARAISRTGGGGASGAAASLAKYDALNKRDPDAAFELLQNDPDVRKALAGRLNVNDHPPN
jgi:hypothetical protein